MSWASSPGVRTSMLGNRRRDTKPELAVRSRLHRLGYRYRVDFRVLPGERIRPDIVFTRRRVAVFIDGCFWHRCPQHGTDPKSNDGYWRPKLNRNVERDRVGDIRLRQAGWTVLRYWEHERPEIVVEDIVCHLAA